MGLAIEVGVLADASEDPEWAADLQEDFDRLSEVLVENGLSPHREPVDIGTAPPSEACFSFPYSFLHYLRRVYAHYRRDPSFRALPLPESEDAGDDPVLEAAYDDTSSHLICHSDCEGYYVPQPFNHVIVADDGRVTGAIVGSSQKLLAELIEVTPALGLASGAGAFDESEAKRTIAQASDDDGLFRELTVWLALYESARRSIESGAAIVFT